jgi:alginate O-acetyltransferase complex protein AlgI
MWLLALSIYGLCKWFTWRLASERAASAPAWRSWAYLLAWPGMAAAEFLDLRQRVVPPGKSEYLLTAANSALGAGLLLLASTDTILARPQIAPWLGLLALGLLLHCGLFHGLSILWRRAGISAPPIMHWSIRATSVADFWGRRWNLAFRELANRFVYRPLIARVGATAALGITFLVSGLIHDLVISLPAGAGYGRPTLYFLLQGVGVLAEHSRIGRRWGLGRGLVGRLFAAVVVLAPIGLMFHRSFLDRVMLPMLQAIAAW